jgi:hypothetical protein
MESCRTQLGGRDNTMIVHVKKATEIRLDDLVQVSAGFLSGGVLNLIRDLSQHDGDTYHRTGGAGRRSMPWSFRP